MKCFSSVSVTGPSSAATEGASAATEACCSDASCDCDFPTAPDNEVISLFSRKGTPLHPGGRRLFLFYLVSEAIFLLHGSVDRR